MPTFLPGCMRVPRWRTIILPARIDCEPNILTPSRLDSESRPLRDEPPAFLCAIYIAFIPQWKPFHYRLCRCAVLYRDRKSTRLNSSHQIISYAVFCLKKKKKQRRSRRRRCIDNGIQVFRWMWSFVLEISSVIMRGIVLVQLSIFFFF